jgi:S1-C subfamily serine protease
VIAVKKRILSFILTVFLLSGTAFAATYTAESVWYPVLVNGAEMTFTEAGGLPMVYNGRTMLPLRALAEALGISIEWKNERVEVTTLDMGALINSCVMIHAENGGPTGSQGSGVLIDYDEILTCKHVVDGMDSISAIYNYNSIDEKCTLEKTSSATDSVIIIPPRHTSKPAPIGDSDTVKVGDSVYVISCPQGKKNVVTNGTVTTINVARHNDKYNVPGFKVTSVSKPGSSGGAVFNIKGELIGIVEAGGEDSSFVIPINDIRKSLAA